ncbi:MAG: DinB family protein [Terriglobales bacterium]
MATSTPSFTPEIARINAEIMLKTIEHESAITTKVIMAVTNPDFRLDPKSFTAGDLAWHVASSEIGVLDWIATGNEDFEALNKQKPNSISGVLEWYQAHLPKAIAAVRGLSGDKLAEKQNFAGVLFNYPRFIYLQFAINHSVHHRGQLSAYLRPMGSKVPQIYGGSADEPWQG